MKLKYLIVILICFTLTACVTAPSGSPGLVTKIKRLFAPTPVQQAERVSKKIDTQTDELLAQAHEGIHATNAALSSPEVPEEKRVEIARPFAKAAENAIESARGPLTSGKKDLLEMRVVQLSSGDFAQNAEALKWMGEWRNAISERSEIKAELEKQRSDFEVEKSKWAQERDAVALKWERRKFWFIVAVVAFVLVVWVLPAMAKIWPAANGVASIVHRVFAPFASSALERSKDLNRRLVASIEQIRKQALLQFDGAKDAVDGVLVRKITHADGSAQLVDQIRREQGLI